MTESVGSTSKDYVHHDGFDHINIYSRGKSVLGRRLSHFTRRPFIYKGTYFASLEAYWHWRKVNGDSVRVDNYELRHMHGVAALETGREFRVSHCEVNEPAHRFYEDLMGAIRNSLLSAPVTLSELTNLPSDTPLEHYHVGSGGKIVRHPEWERVLEIYEMLRIELKQK